MNNRWRIVSQGLLLGGLELLNKIKRFYQREDDFVGVINSSQSRKGKSQPEEKKKQCGGKLADISAGI